MKSKLAHTKESWHEFAGDLILSTDAEKNDTLRRKCSNGLFWLQMMHYNHTKDGPEHTLRRAEALQEAISAIGLIVLQNLMDNGITCDSLGKCE